jgi:1-acyl-sn-glycerol-3-phosphate acyltransferase
MRCHDAVVSVGSNDRETRYARLRLGPVALLRGVVRLLLLPLVTLTWSVPWAIGALWPFHDNAGRAALRRGITRRWASACCRVLGGRIEVLGDLPRGPGFLVANHVSYLDIPVLMALTGCRFVSKREVADWPVIGFYARKAGTLFVNRGKAGRDAGRALEGMARALEEGDLVAFFPEGTTSAGEGVLPFRSGLLTLPARAGHPVWPAALSYEAADPALDSGVALAWHCEQSLLRHGWRLMCMPGFSVRVAIAHAVEAPHRKHLAQSLYHRVALMHAGLNGTAGAAVFSSARVEVTAEADLRARPRSHV